MAVIQYTGIVNQVRGKLNGSVFSKSRNANTLQRKQMPPKGSRGFQSEIRNVFSNVQRQWKNVLPAGQVNWGIAAENNPSRDRFGNQTILSGYNQYIKANIFRWYALGFISDVVAITPAPAITITDFTIVTLDFTTLLTGEVSVDYEFSFSASGSLSAFGYIVDISLPVSRGVTQYYKRYSFVVGGELTGDILVSGTVSIGNRYPSPVATQRVIARVRGIFMSNGAVVQEEFTDKIF